jgi:hypothetical protein
MKRIDMAREMIVRDSRNKENLPIFRQAVEDFMNAGDEDIQESFLGASKAMRDHARQLAKASELIEDIRRQRLAANDIRPRGYIPRTENSLFRGGRPFLKNVYSMFQQDIDPNEALSSPVLSVLKPLGKLQKITVSENREALQTIPSMLSEGSDAVELSRRYASSLISRLCVRSPALFKAMGLDDPERLQEALASISGSSRESDVASRLLEPGLFHYQLQRRSMMADIIPRDMNRFFDPAMNNGKLDSHESPFKFKNADPEKRSPEILMLNNYAKDNHSGFISEETISSHLSEILGNRRADVLSMLKESGLNLENSRIISDSPDILL